MNANKLIIEKSKFDINLKFYFILKYLLKASFSDRDIKKIIEIYSLYKGIVFKEELLNSMDSLYGNSKSGLKKKDFLTDILDLFESDFDSELFIFGVKLIAIKPLLLQEAKTRDLLDTSKLPTLSPLSLAYDKITLFSPYSTRVSGALLSLIFFDKLENEDTAFISSDTTEFLSYLSKEAIVLKNMGIEANQIFMLMFSESINQSIISDSGSNYEDRILSVLNSIGIDKSKISKTHDKNDSSTEFDFFFELNNKTYGIGAKRTLRERYKQFIKTAQMTKIDVMIEITLGIDLTEEKVNSIRKHNIFLFISDEVYNSNKYLQKIDGVYSSKDLTLQTLEKLSYLK
ncbi:MAG: type II restriction endonuclease [Sulfurimonas sp.]|uniref:type II restriction endonuclease n=1 Tax=Sulfurimonas sp. TaxID=2022749 RepID=UPI0026298CEB|nr:type II restriction endonuclease [Sulfurimonas sp.]MDD3476166.1 type II restriction endonuclease [Sulfurimonas sp.]